MEMYKDCSKNKKLFQASWKRNPLANIKTVHQGRKHFLHSPFNIFVNENPTKDLVDYRLIVLNIT